MEALVFNYSTYLFNFTPQDGAADGRDGDGPEATGQGQHHRGDAGQVGRPLAPLEAEEERPERATLHLQRGAPRGRCRRPRHRGGVLQDEVIHACLLS